MKFRGIDSLKANRDLTIADGRSASPAYNGCVVERTGVAKSPSWRSSKPKRPRTDVDQDLRRVSIRAARWPELVELNCSTDAQQSDCHDSLSASSTPPPQGPPTNHTTVCPCGCLGKAPSRSFSGVLSGCWLGGGAASTHARHSVVPNPLSSHRATSSESSPLNARLTSSIVLQRTILFDRSISSIEMFTNR